MDSQIGAILAMDGIANGVIAVTRVIFVPFGDIPASRR